MTACAERDVSQLLDLGLRILQDAAAKCYTVTVADWPLDFKRLKSRVKHEGLSFLTITLPTFGKAFEQCLARGKVAPSDFTGWAKKGCLPVFLWGFTSLVFERSGCLKEEPDVAAIEGVRQVAYTFKKILLACTPEREDKALQEYLQIEQELREPSVLSGLSRNFDRVCRLLWGDVFGGDLDCHQLIPKHGPGSTAEGITGNRKYRHRTWPDGLQPYFPFDETAYPNTLLGVESLGSTKFLRGDEELPVKVLFVLKTLSSPRVIAKEPVAKQYTQQGLSSHMISKLEANRITSGHINFTDQTVNQELAIAGSKSGEICTLDLVSASDRVPNSGVERMLDVAQDLLGALQATRSTHALLPGIPVPLELRKFASMGSATCFPIEAMYFFSVILTSIWESSGHPLTLESLYECSRDVYVYGDDIIIPTDAVEVVLAALAEANCKVGIHKSFWTGKFRESCGVDAYDGEVVTPTYLRYMPPEGKRDASGVISWIATSNLFYKRGYWRTAAYMKSYVESIVGNLPLVQENAPGLGWENYQQGYTVQRWNKRLHRYEVRTYAVSTKYDEDPLDGSPALMKALLSLIKREEENPDRPYSITKAAGGSVSVCVENTAEHPPLWKQVDARWRTRDETALAQEQDHLRCSVRRGAVSIKRRWTTPY